MTDRSRHEKEKFKKVKNNYIALKVDKFNDYEQREYDYAALEKGLLGWNE